MNEAKYKSYEELPLMLSVPQVADVLGIGRALRTGQGEGFSFSEHWVAHRCAKG